MLLLKTIVEASEINRSLLALKECIRAIDNMKKQELKGKKNKIAEENEQKTCLCRTSVS